MFVTLYASKGDTRIGMVKNVQIGVINVKRKASIRKNRLRWKSIAIMSSSFTGRLVQFAVVGATGTIDFTHREHLADKGYLAPQGFDDTLKAFGCEVHFEQLLLLFIFDVQKIGDEVR